MTRCCEIMEENLIHDCELHDKYECPDTIMIKFKNGLIGISVKDGGTSIIACDYCPWCGTDIIPKEIV